MRAENLPELIGKFSNLRLAQEFDGATLAAFARAQLMKVKGTAVGFDRGDDFFSLYRAYADQYWVFTVLNDDGSLAGVMSVTRSRMQVNGESRWIGYLGDLRIDPKACASAHRQWKEFYGALVLHLENPENPEYCDHLIAAVFQENLHALNVLRNRVMGVIHHDLCAYHNLSIFHPGSLSRAPRGLRVEQAERKDVEALERPSLTMSSLPSSESIRPLIVRDDLKKPLFGALLWDARRSRSLRVLGLPWRIRWFFKLLSLLGPVEYSESKPLIMKCLSCLSLQSGTDSNQERDALTALVEFCFRGKSRDFHILNLTLTDPHLCRSLQKRFPLSKSTAGWLFEITSPDRAPSLPKSDVAFEGAFL